MNEAMWCVLRKECMLEQMRRGQAAMLLEEVSVHRSSRFAAQGRRLRRQLGRLLLALGRRLESADASLTAEKV
jgi:hypothetical protein